MVNLQPLSEIQFPNGILPQIILKELAGKLSCRMKGNRNISPRVELVLIKTKATAHTGEHRGRHRLTRHRERLSHTLSHTHNTRFTHAKAAPTPNALQWH